MREHDNTFPLEPHPLADLFPLIQGDEFDELVASIRKDGLLQPIMLFDGMILDGRNRYRACKEAGVEPHFERMDGASEDDIRAYVRAANICRRSLTTSQRAMIIAQLESAGQPVGDLTRIHDVSDRQVAKARAVLRSGDAEVISLVERGAVSVNRAEDVIAGKVPRAGLETRYLKQSDANGRPRGNARVHRLRRGLEIITSVADYDKVIASNWPGEPGLNDLLRKGERLLRNLVKSTQEADRATAVA